MTIRLTFYPDAAARTAKNAHTAPGLPSQPRDDRSERNTMVDTYVPGPEGPDSVTVVAYTPEDLNRLVSRGVAGRLRERAQDHEDAAQALFYGTARWAWHTGEADALRAAADRELRTAGLGEGR